METAVGRVFWRISVSVSPTPPLHVSRPGLDEVLFYDSLATNRTRAACIFQHFFPPHFGIVVAADRALGVGLQSDSIFCYTMYRAKRSFD